MSRCQRAVEVTLSYSECTAESFVMFFHWYFSLVVIYFSQQIPSCLWVRVALMHKSTGLFILNPERLHLMAEWKMYLEI